MDQSTRDKENQVIGVTTTVLSLAVASYVFRLVGRSLAGAKFWYDDYVMGVATVLASLASGCNYLGLRYGLGQHTRDLPPDKITNYLLTIYALQLISLTTVFVNKIGILLFYWRLFPGRTFHRWIIAVGLYVTLFTIASAFAFIFQCTPISGFWDHEQSFHCVDQNSLDISTGALNIFSDVLILAMPMPIIWKLQTTRPRKLGLFIVFSLGSFVCVVSIVRVILLSDINRSDFTYTNVSSALWSAIESEIGVVSANLPSTRPLFPWVVAKASSNKSVSTLIKSFRSRGKGFSRVEDPGYASNPTSQSTEAIAQKSSEADSTNSQPDIELPTYGIKITTRVEQDVESQKQPAPSGQTHAF